MNTGKHLIDEINSAALGAGEVALWWLGQHSFILKAPGGVVYMDPFLIDLPGRLIPPLLTAGEITNAALVLGTHDHIDHIDRDSWPAIAKASPGAKFVVPDLLLPRLAKDLGIPAERFIGLDDGRSVEVSSIRVTAIPAAHEMLNRDEATGRYPYLGYIVEASARTVYHSGDCCIYEGLAARLKKWKLDAMLLPINGRDARRLAAGCIGNMTFQEAAGLAGAVSPGLAIPTHYDMFAMNSANPGDFADYMKVKYPSIPVHICRYVERFLLGA